MLGNTFYYVRYHMSWLIMSLVIVLATIGLLHAFAWILNYFSPFFPFNDDFIHLARSIKHAVWSISISYIGIVAALIIRGLRRKEPL